MGIPAEQALLCEGLEVKEGRKMCPEVPQVLNVYITPVYRQDLKLGEMKQQGTNS